jgi:uncharacterized protein (DUF2147 family)
MRAFIAIAALGMLTVALAPRAGAVPPPPPIEGYWKNPSGSAIVAIGQCGTDFCGKVAWASTAGQREAAKTTSHVVGTTVLTDLALASPDHWIGRLFIPDDNIHASAKLQLVTANQLKLSGCVFAGLICRSQVWSRVEPPLKSGE